MLFTRRRRRGGIGIGGILLIGGLLYGTGAGGAILDSMKSIPTACASQLGSMNPAVSRSVCGMSGQMVSMITNASTAIGDKLDGFFGGLLGKNQSIGFTGNSGFSGQGMGGLNISGLLNDMDMGALGDLISGEAVLAQMMQQGPSGFQVGESPAQQLQAAINSFALGQQYLTPGGTSYQPNTGISWMQQGANQQEFGLLPQLALGNMYMQGGHGISQNPQAAVQYYAQALQSVQQLQASPQPGAQQVLASLPVSPAQLQNELIAVIRAIKPQ